MKILLVRLGALGDIVHALPVAAALRERFPDARIDWLVDARHAALLDLVPAIDGRIVVAAEGPRRHRPAAQQRFAGRPGWLRPCARCGASGTTRRSTCRG